MKWYIEYIIVKGDDRTLKFIISGKNLEITDALRDRVINKVGKLDRLFDRETEAHVTMGIEKNRHIVEVTIPFNGIILRGEVASTEMYDAIDRAEEILERQIRRNKTKLMKKMKSGGIRVTEFPEEPQVEEEEYNVVKTKKFPTKPMDVDEAILQMNLVGHEFFVFMNVDTGQANVVYKRKDGDYGLIEPEK